VCRVRHGREAYSARAAAAADDDDDAAADDDDDDEDEDEDAHREWRCDADPPRFAGEW
jgi:hypothetical protein